MAKANCKIADFNSAYFRRHGTQPKPLNSERYKLQAETIISAAGCSPGPIIAELDLEAKPKWELFRIVSSGDSMVAKAGRGIFQLTFTALDGHGRLVFMAFNSGRYEGEGYLAEGEVLKVWGGLLMDFRGFSVTLERMQLHKEREGALGCVRICAIADASMGPF